MRYAQDPLADEDDRRLVEAIKAGDERALEALYDRHAPVVLALCRRILGDSPDAEDALMDAFTQLWDRVERYDAGRSSPLGYLMTIARSRALDRLRSRSRQRSAGVSPTDLELLEAAAMRGGRAPSPLDSAVIEERRAQVQHALATLSELQREPLELSFFQGLTHAEISERLGLPLGTVKTRIRQGLIRLRGQLETPVGERSGS